MSLALVRHETIEVAQYTCGNAKVLLQLSA